MNTFIIINRSIVDYDCIVISNSYESPLNDLDAVIKELKREDMTSGRLLFDLLLSVGNNSDRFVEAEFHNGSFIMESFKCVTVPKNSAIRSITPKYISLNIKMLECSILNNMQKKILEKGIAI